MSFGRKPSAGIIAAAIVEIFGCLLVILMGLLVVLTSRLGRMAQLPNQPEDVRHTLLVGQIVWIFLIAIAVFGVLVGVELFQLKNWARITMIVWASLQAGFSALAMVMTFFILSVMPAQPGLSPDVMQVMRFLLPLFYLIPLGIGVWWLILFTRKSIAAQFRSEVVMAAWPVAPGAVSYDPMTGQAVSAPQYYTQPVAPSKPRCPLPVAIVAGYMVFSAVSTLLAFAFTRSAPQFLMGHVVYGLPAFAFLGTMAALDVAGAVGIFRLKPWGIYIALGVQLFYLLNILVDLVTPDMEGRMREAMSRMNLPHNNPILFDPARFAYGILFFAAIIGAVILAILLTYRSRFLEAAEESASTTSSTT